jgi:probable HAF family extracellular repeat protein
MAVDSNRNVAVVYGGFVGGSPGTNDETWEWDFATRSWSLRGYGIFDYAGRIGSEMAYDPNLRQVILFGGVPYWTCPTSGGTYAWDGSSWRPVSTAGPGGRVAHAMVTDPIRSRVVMYGGAANYDCNSNTELFDTWEWNGASWTKLADAPNSPDINRGTSAAYDANVGRIVLFGGYVSANTWQWDGAAWKLQAATNPPSARLTSISFDPSAGQLVLFGGGIGAFVAVWPTGIGNGAGDTWTANGQAPTTLNTLRAVAPYGGVATLSATLLANGSSLRDQSIEFRVDNAVIGTATTDASGVASIDVQLDARGAGTYSNAIRASFAGAPQYAPGSGTADLVVTKAVPQIVWPSPQPITYGTPLGAQQLNASVTVVGTLAYTPPAGTLLDGGVHSLNVTFTPDDTRNYETVQTSVSLTVLQAVPTIDWRQPAPITFGTPLSSLQLNARASVDGTYEYVPGFGAILQAGADQTLNVTFTPTDGTNYAVARASVTITVNKATPIVTWLPPAPIVYGTALSAAQLNASVDVAASLVYSPAPGFVPGGTTTLFVNVFPVDTNNYVSTSASVLLVVDPAPTTTTLNASQTSIAAGEPVTLVATLSVPALASANGTTMQFFDRTTLLGTATLFGANGVFTASLTRTFSDVGGTHSLHATFAGNTLLLSSTSTSAGVTVAPPLFAYAFVDLGTLGGAFSLANGVNRSGQIVGVSTDALGLSRAFIYENGAMRDLGLPAGMVGIANAISTSGQVVGYMQPSNGYRHAFTFAAGLTQDLGTLGGNSSVATAVNDAGDIVGFSDVANSSAHHAFLFRSGAMIDLGTLGGANSEAVGVDGFGRVVVNSQVPGNANDYHVFVWDNGTRVDIGTLGGTYAIARGVNAAGQIVGESTTRDGRTHGFLYADGRFTDLGEIFNTIRPTAINDSGQVVGFNQWVAISEAHATILRDGHLSDLNIYLPSASGWRYLSTPNAINEKGVLVGYGYRAADPQQNRAYLLSPQAITSLSVPNVSGIYGKAVDISATLSAAAVVQNKTLTLVVDGSLAGTAVTDAHGTATFTVAGLNAGTHAVSVSFAGDLDLTGTKAPATLTLAKAGVSLKWTAPNAITYGTPLGSDQLNATATVPGTFTYTPPAGTILNAGAGQQLSAVFTPTDSVNYEGASVSVVIDVNAAVPALTWSTPTPIVYGTTLSAVQLNATSSVAGTFTYTPPVGTLLNAGAQTLLATFTPDDQQNYGSGEISVLLVIQKANQPALSLDAPATLVYGATASLMSGGGGGNGVVTFDTGTSTGCSTTFNSLRVTNASGTCSVTASKAGDSNYNGPVTSPTAIVTLQKAAQGTLAITGAPANAIFGTSFSVAATGGSSTGAITFAASEACSNTEGGSLITMTSGTGNCVITATKATDDNYLDGASPATLVPATTAPTSTSLSSSLNPATYGQSIMLTASVTSVAGRPTGSVTFLDGGATIGSALLNVSGQATLTVNLAAGTHNLTAAYGGSTNFTRSASSPVSESIATATTTTALSSSPNPSGIGQTVNFVGTVTGQYGGAVTGTVTFYQGPNTILGTAPLIGGTATLSLSNLGSGPHVVTASYGGDTNSTGSTSPSVTQNVVAPSVATTTTLSSSLNPSIVGQQVTFTAVVTPTPADMGTVTFRLGQTPLATVALSNGVAQYSTPTLPAGSLGITAVYNGDMQFAASTSAVYSQLVNKATTTTTLSAIPSTSGTSVTFYVNVSVTNSPVVVPTGSVSLKENNTILATTTVDATGNATFSITLTGRHNLKAVYAGDANTTNSTSTSVQLR